MVAASGLLGLFTFPVWDQIYRWLSATWESFLSINSNSDLLISQLSTLLADDLLLPAILCYVLHGYENGFTSFKQLNNTEDMISKLVMFALERGVLMCAMDIGILVNVLNDRDNGTATGYIVWVNSVLASLNARRYLRKLGTSSSQIQDTPLTTFRVSSSAPKELSEDIGISC
ncbi:hypothetical protein WOLCODRAFT_145820 [Wolfiporia cocos MD-104 SS10]|uniref:DUF6534 domain-containing protein n=1 Tax=Wolfiporia cocos (strain MD-104) TaxID=742152 RepID=A0A2H3J190_WOLCO|nr:hypothetical protein WOLCODRAFT_145820 [Wolfiporia cocos MD-104 SS10]